MCFLIRQSSQENLNQTNLNELTYTNNKVKKLEDLSKYDSEENYENCENCRKTIKSSPFAKLLTARYIVPVFRITTCIKIRLLYAKRSSQYIKL